MKNKDTNFKPGQATTGNAGSSGDKKWNKSSSNNSSNNDRSSEVGNEHYSDVDADIDADTDLNTGRKSSGDKTLNRDSRRVSSTDIDSGVKPSADLDDEDARQRQRYLKEDKGTMSNSRGTFEEEE